MNGFSLWVGIGAALGLWRVWHSAPERQSGLWIDLSLLSLFGALVGARLFYVWQNWEFYDGRWVEIAQLSQGGLGWPGAVAGAAVVIVWFALSQRKPGNLRQPRFTPGRIGDRLYPILPPLAVSAWLGCWQIGASYGAALPEKTWWAIPALDETGVVSPRFPLQPLAALTLLLLFWLIEARAKTPRAAGWLSAMGLTVLLLHLLAFSLLLAEPAPMWNGLRLETWAAILMLAVFLILLAVYTLGIYITRRHFLQAR